jgi:hypothetical protein
MIRTALIAAGFAMLAAPAFAGTLFTVEFAAPAAKDKIVAEDAVWTCSGAVCTADLSRKKPTVATCKKLVKAAGTVKALRTAKAELPAEAVAACNGGK